MGDIIVQSSLLLNPNHSKDHVITAAMRIKELQLMCKEYKAWLPMVASYGVLLTADLFLMNFFCTIALYVFYNGKIPLIESSGFHIWMDRNLYFAISGGLNALCQIAGNRASYYTSCVRAIGQRHPMYFVMLQLVAGVLC